MGKESLTTLWLEHLNSASSLGLSSPIPYRYPLSDWATDENLEQQDQGMRQREQALYTEWLAGDWEAALDFGCGTGANFKCFDQHMGLLVGLEPDPSRAGAAQERANLLAHIQSVVVCGDISFLEGAPPPLSLDRILCSQILGHVPEHEIGRILRVFSARLRKGGSCAISIPVVGAAFTGDPSAGGWGPGNDFLHLVNFSVSPFDPDYRERVYEGNFNQQAAHPQSGVLPVRCFWLQDFPDDPQPGLPVSITRIPGTIEQQIGTGMQVSQARLYSIHKTQNGKACIGDLLIILKKVRG